MILSITIPKAKQSKKLTVPVAAKLMGISPQWLREMLKANEVPFGTATKGTGDKWKYYIYPAKFTEYTGKKVN